MLVKNITAFHPSPGTEKFNLFYRVKVLMQQDLDDLLTAHAGEISSV